MIQTICTKNLHNKKEESPKMSKEEHNSLEWESLEIIKEIINELAGAIIEDAKCSVNHNEKEDIISGLMLNIKRKDGTRAVFCFESDEKNSYPCYSCIAEIR